MRARAQAPRRLVPSARGSRSRTEAATELVRLDSEPERPTSGADPARRRLATTIEALKTVDRRIQWLMDCNDLLNQSVSVAILRPRGETA